MQTLTATDVPVRIENENVEVRMAEVGEMTVSFIRLAKGTDLGPALVGLEGDLCPCPHWGYMLEGRLLMRTAEGEKTYRAGEAFYWAAGHAPVALEDCAYVDFSPTEQFMPVIRHIEGG
jgi:hypothetical protein